MGKPGYLLDKTCVLVQKVILDTALTHLFFFPKRHFAKKKRRAEERTRIRELRFVGE